ncbi:MAG: DUF4339 domain-containing protein, partial [Gemmataceae bacterium]|nr:DUF4339 domain-containing protein [Gemmataceae bacterium]
MPDWYYAKNGQQQGPVNSAHLKQMAASGQIGPTDLVFQEGGTQWVEASTVKGLQFGGGAAPPPAPVAPSRGRDDRDDRDRDRGRDDRDRDKDRGRRRDDDGELPEDDFDRPRYRGRRNPFIDFLLVKGFTTPWILFLVYWLGVYFIVDTWVRQMYVTLTLLSYSPRVTASMMFGMLNLFI